MKKLVILTLALTSLAIASSCGTKQEVPKPAEDVQQAADDGVFKYTITTDIDAENDRIEILVALNSVDGQYPVRYDLDCEGDGEFEYKGLTDNKKCIYKKNSGKHQIWVRGEIPGMFLCARQRVCPEGVKCNFQPRREPAEQDHSKDAVISIDSWGNVSWKSMDLFAASCTALNKLPEDSPNLSQVSDMMAMFSHATSFNQPLDKWDVSNVTDMSALFSQATSFNQPLEAWDVSNVTNMRFMFDRATSFNQPLNKWNVSNVTDMLAMFSHATSFNQPLDKWNVSHVTNMVWMFFYATSFNQPLEAWDVSNVTNMGSMFSHATSFNQPLDKWDVSEVGMTDMFEGAESFSYYPNSWVITAQNSEDMFTGTKVEAEVKKQPDAAETKKQPDAADGIGFVTITAESEAQVYIDGKLVSYKSSVTKQEVTSGTHTIRVYFPDTKKFSKPREILVDKDATMSVHFTKEMSR